MIEADGLHALLHENAALADALMRGQALDFRAMVRQVCDLKLRTAAQRLGSYLLELSQQQYARGGPMRLPIGKQLLAAQLGCRPENISRAFASLREIGVETHGKLVILHDIPRLQEFAFSAGPEPAYRRSVSADEPASTCRPCWAHGPQGLRPASGSGG